MSERHCLKCEHCTVDVGTPAYSDVTPGDDASVKCGKGHWTVWDPQGGVRVRLCKYMTMAETCVDYQEEGGK